MSLIPSGFAKSAAEAGFYDHPIEQSLRFNDDDSAYLSRTPSSTGNRKTFTISFWVKRANINVGGKFYQQRFDSNSSQQFSISWLNNENIRIIDQNSSGVSQLIMDTTAVFRDPSAWYHIVVAVDTTQATAADRCKLWVNGEQVTDVTTAVQYTQNYDTSVNTTDRILIGCQRPNSSSTLNSFSDNYFAEYHLIDGTALDASSFGETKSGVWIPKAYSGSYGTNGFYLDFGNSGSIGADVSGNGNNFTANNLAATDVVLDSPTNNFATLNPLDWDRTANQPTFYEGNLKISASNGGAYSSIAIPNSGKWYFEMYAQSVNSSNNDAVALGASYGSDITSSYYWRAYRSTGVKDDGSSSTSYGGSWGTGDLIGTAWDADTGTLSFYKNGTSLGSAWTGLTPPDVNKFFVYPRSSVSTGVMIANFGQDSSFAGNKTAQGNTDDNGYGDFYYAPPTGYLALCTANLTVPDAMNPALDASPQDYFNTVLYTGNETARTISGVGFEPDFLWIKSRNNATDSTTHHTLLDKLRTLGYRLRSNTTDAEQDYTSYFGDFETDGFSLPSADVLNKTGGTYVAWNWKANGSGVSNTDGSITSTVSANTDAGFSVITYTGDGGTTSTIGHGLNEAPDIAIFKCRSTASTGWIVNSPTLLGTGQNLILNTTAAKAYSASSDFVYGASTIQLDYGDWANGSGRTYVCYAFHNVEGFSKFGSYTGNGSTDGTFCYTGFKPAFVIIKKTSAADNWTIMDTERSPYNYADDFLIANGSDAESNRNITGGIDIVSNGFKLRHTDGSVNGSGASYIFMAFSENPLKFSTAV